MKHNLTKSDILRLAEEYDYALPPSYQNAKSLTKRQFLDIAGWKSARPRKLYQMNDEEYVVEVTTAAFSINASEQFRIETLTLLKGVQYPVASAILHFGFSDTYPIIDYRALWTLWGIEPKDIRYTPQLWIDYVTTCRTLAEQYDLGSEGVRILDKALWQYSSTNQQSEDV